VGEYRSAKTRLRLLGIAAFLVLLVTGLFASLAHAEGSPNISATVSSSSPLYGEPAHVTLDAADPLGQPYGYNLSYRVVLPKGVSYEGGSAVPPTVIANQPAAEETTLIFSNVTDLSPNSHKELSFNLTYNQSVWHAGDVIPVRAQAFINTDPRFVPKFSPTGQPEGPSSTSYTGFSAEVTGEQRLKAIKVTAEEPSPEGEMLRGVHEDQTVYTLKVQNNGINPTTGTELDAYVPAGLEFLGCGAPGGAGTDHTHDAIATNPGSAEEYPGSGPIKVESLAECQTPELVETEEFDPDGPGPMPFGVYTHVRWNVGTLTAGEVKTFKYRAAVPIRANAKEFTGGAKPSGASGEQAANLDNNTGPEVIDETSLPTLAFASGTYQGTTPTPTSDETVLDRTAEDWVVHKGVEASRLEQGQNVKWTLTFETSEYKYVKEGVVTDTLPDGLCPLGPENFTSENDAPDAECDPVAGKEPSSAYSSAIENADGTWTLTWNAAQFTPVQHTAINDRFTLTFWTHTRTHYQENFLPTTPILSRDKITNGVTTEAEGFARCVAPEATNCESPAAKISHQVADGTIIGDASSATLEAESPTLEKFVSTGSANCATATYVKAPTVPVFHPGDKVCWKLRITFPGTLDTDAQTIADFLPPGSKYLAGTDEPHGENNVVATLDESAAANGVLTWTAENSTVPAGGQIFERVIATEVAPVGNIVSGDLKGNLLKFSSANTPGESEALRAEADYEIATPVIGLVKGVEKVVRGGTTVDGPNGENVDHVQVEEGDEVTYRVDVKNTGGVEAVNTEVWDILPAEYSCSEVTGISEAGQCLTTGPGDHIVWMVPLLTTTEPGNHRKLTYTVTVPPNIGPGRTLVNTAGVAQFQTGTNAGGNFTYTPAENINPENTTEPNAPAAKDPSNVFTAGAAAAKTETTSVTEGGNNEQTQATIGETITYTLTAEVPEGTTLGGQAELTDTLNSAELQAYVAGSAEATLNGAALSGGFELNTSGTTPKVIFPAGYNNAAGSGVDKVVLKFSVVVTNVVANVRGATLTDQAKLAWTDPSLGPQSISSATLTTTVVEPLISQEKKDDKNPSRVVPGEIVTYTLKTANSGAANVSTAHEVELVDHIPFGLIVLNSSTNKPASDGILPLTGGAVWNSTTRTITKLIPTIAPAGSTSFSYKVEVENPAVAGSSLTNEVKTTTASLAAGPAQGRTSGSGYAAKAEDTVRLIGASIEKSSTPASATPGDPLTYHLKVTIPASIELFDSTVRDVLPTGVEFDGYGAVTCLSGCPLANPTHQYKASVSGTTGKETIAWDLGDIPGLGEPQVIEFTYSAHLRATNRVVGGNVVKGNTEINAATVSSDLTNKQGTFNENVIPTTFDETSPEAKTTTTVIEPLVTIDKKIKVGSGGFTDGPTVAHSNEPLAYQLIVRNEGNSPAYDVKVTDAPDPAVTNVQVSPQAGVTVTEPWSETTHALTLEIAGRIPAAGSTTIEYTAEFVAASKLHDGQQVKNTAAVAKYFGVPASERLAHEEEEEKEEEEGKTVDPWEFREYSGGSDSTEAILDFPTFTLAKTTGLSGNPDAGKAEVGQEFPWRIVATNTSATAGATNVLVTDTLPPNWTYTAGTAKFNGAAAPDPAITPHAGGDTLEWTVPSLPAASAVTITYGAKPSLAAETNPGTAAEANVNTALISSATDEAGNSGDEEGPYGTPPDTAKATLGLPALTLEKTPDGGAATAGEPSSFTIKVKNTGNAVARNLDVEDVLPEGLGYTAGEATGTPAPIGSEAVTPDTPSTGETTIHWHLASLAENATETITVPVAVAADVPNGTTLVNDAQVTSEEVTTPAHDEGSLVVSTEADMSIEKSGGAAYTAGENYTWHLRVKDLGPSDALGVEVKDPLPAGTAFVSADAPCALSGGEVKCAIGTVAVGFDQTYDVTVHLDPNATASPLSNTATVSTTTEDTHPGNNSSTFGPTPSPLADVSVVKTAAPELILFSQETEFTLEVANAGPSTARAVKLVDPLPTEGLEFVSADPPCTQAGGTVTCEFGDLEPGATETVHVKANGVKDGTWANTATVSTTTPEPPGPEAEENDHSTAQVGVGPVADLAIVKTGPATVAAGGQVTWALEVTNNGPDAATGVKAVDTLPAGVEFVSADSGCAEAAGTVGGGTVTCAIGDLALGESTVRHITVTVPPALGDQTLLNTAVVGGEQGDLEPENNHSEVKTTVGPSADLALTKTGPAHAGPDSDITWTLIATNKGPSTATGVKVEDGLPSGVTLVSATPSQGSCNSGVSCSLGNLAAGGSAQIQIVGHVSASLANAKIENTAKIGGDQPDPNPENNSSSATTQVDDAQAPTFNLTLVKSLVGPANPQLGDVLTYTLTVGNEGPGVATAVKVTDTLPGALKYVSTSLPGGKCSSAGPVVTCKLASLAAGEKKTATLKARATAAGTVKNTASVGAEHADAKQSDNHDAAVASVAAARAESAGSPVLHLVKKRLGHGAIEAGRTVAFKIQVKNSGRGAAADVVVCDRLPGAMSFVSVAGAKFEHGNACWKVAMLAPGGSRSFHVVARIDGGLGSRTVRNVATVEADNAPNRRAVAPVRVKSSGSGRGGGVTG
jgi:uncharacterized repeat protein (TIGR01451 family)/fimbrial isopeptide formation D2 family protein